MKIDQVAIAPKKAATAKALLEALGVTQWVEDKVSATGQVRGKVAANQANLSFNYDFIPGIEFEVLEYTEGDNFVAGHTPCAAHLGMHVDDDAEMHRIHDTLTALGIEVVQNVSTFNHTNPAIAGKRRYNYLIFKTRDILGLDLKFIKRLETEDEA